MDILFYHPTLDLNDWLQPLQQALPNARIRAWTPADTEPADYALVWKPPVEVLRHRQGLQAVFSLGAGVDAILSQWREYPDMLAQGVGLYRLEDTGMGQQMQEYAVSQVLHWFRRFDDYQAQKDQSQWRPLEPYCYDDFTVGLLGAGVLGGQVARSLAAWGFPVRCWSRTGKTYPGVSSYAGDEQLGHFLSGTKVLINLLPNTPQTTGIINRHTLSQLADYAYVLNLARGSHLVEEDLLAALNSGKLKGAMLDVFFVEPLPKSSPLWHHPRVSVTPHIAAVTRASEAIDFIASTISIIEQGAPACGNVSLSHGY